MSVTLRFVKLDNRYKGSNCFKYYLLLVNSPFQSSNRFQTSLETINKFNEIRDWCIQNWGTSTELEDYVTWYDTDICNFNEHWSWSIEGTGRRIYLKSDQEKLWAELTWK